MTAVTHRSDNRIAYGRQPFFLAVQIMHWNETVPGSQCAFPINEFHDDPAVSSAVHHTSAKSVALSSCPYCHKRLFRKKWRSSDDRRDVRCAIRKSGRMAVGTAFWGTHTRVRNMQRGRPTSWGARTQERGLHVVTSLQTLRRPESLGNEHGVSEGSRSKARERHGVGKGRDGPERRPSLPCPPGGAEPSGGLVGTRRTG